MNPVAFLYEAFQNLLLHKARSTLAVLGIIFGVASVICMNSISEVARRDVITRIERMGLNNVVLDSVKPEDIRKQEKTQAEQSWYASYGVTRADLEIMFPHRRFVVLADMAHLTELLPRLYLKMTA